jgi:hypothetical protein
MNHRWRSAMSDERRLRSVAGSNPCRAGRRGPLIASPCSATNPAATSRLELARDDALIARAAVRKAVLRTFVSGR